MTFDLKGRAAVVTGSGKKTGIGYGIVRKLAASGANVIIADLVGKETRQNASAENIMNEMTRLARDLEKTFKIKAFPVALDVTRGDSIAQMADQVQKQFGRIHILCNNAGTVFGVPNTIHTYEEDAWLKTIDVNLHGVFRVSRALDGDGRITNHPQSTIGRQDSPRRVAEAVYQGLIKKKNLMVLSPVGNLAYWLSRFFPNFYERLMARQLKSELN